MDAKQEKAYLYLKDKFETQERFSKIQLNDSVGWGPNIETYWPKKIKTLLIEEKGLFRVSEVFRRVLTKEKFEKHISQSSRVSMDFKTFSFKNVILFDFFLPLSNELYLREALDALFYKDSVLRRLKSVPIEKLYKKFEKNESETIDSYYLGICDWISNKFGGYSISHVNGRFRADKLMTLKEVSEKLVSNGYKYLIDETTGIVRFIFPCGKSTEKLFLTSEDYYDNLLKDSDELEIKDEAEKIRWMFYVLFVQSIIEIINGEDEIWLLESGYRTRLHIWRMEK
ncbi:MAG: hypothetical protein M0P66_11830 [Salinivirgaceae bacterium]|nr:hypothetical protein [Salinivirgaceae bacterium]